MVGADGLRWRRPTNTGLATAYYLAGLQPAITTADSVTDPLSG